VPKVQKQKEIITKARKFENTKEERNEEEEVT
jgi:hypothetical protein